MTKNTKQALGAAAIVVIGYFIWKAYQKNKASAAAPAAAAPSDENSANIVGAGRWVVGAYDASTNETYIFPEGNMGGGKRVRGRINAPQGTMFYPSSAV
jgi:hypothetical protein